MSVNFQEQAERRATERLRQALEEHHHTTLIAVTLGVVVGVGVATGLAVWILNRSRKPRLMTDDPEAPLFV
ncbi:hypothetical protein [Deinococcus peraridilitoris]|uniref:Uncharacterized protein n=1 Tax=Deinococcus peraridilitoris (strain DSM 19664 / LMG 22246 / CIP 109416 / KR-200) TaxID=937777 RepID=K9ZX32_DEIPD|nr:hypothetical protein [Deinococcus peraridilitoris]AFZ66116.1 hypothetical protein Deipe_0521 [Deinococcus peraridilitoris DSM 19664]